MISGVWLSPPRTPYLLMALDFLSKRLMPQRLNTLSQFS